MSLIVCHTILLLLASAIRLTLQSETTCNASFDMTLCDADAPVSLLQVGATPHHRHAEQPANLDQSRHAEQPLLAIALNDFAGAAHHAVEKGKTTKEGPGASTMTTVLKLHLTQWERKEAWCNAVSWCSYCTSCRCGETARIFLFYFHVYITFLIRNAEEEFAEKVTDHGMHLGALGERSQGRAGNYPEAFMEAAVGYEHSVGHADIDALFDHLRNSFAEVAGHRRGILQIGPPENHPREEKGRTWFDHSINIEVDGHNCYFLQSWVEKFSVEDWLDDGKSKRAEHWDALAKCKGFSHAAKELPFWPCLSDDEDDLRSSNCQTWLASREKYGLGKAIPCDHLRSKGLSQVFYELVEHESPATHHSEWTYGVRWTPKISAPEVASGPSRPAEARQADKDGEKDAEKDAGKNDGKKCNPCKQGEKPPTCCVLQ